MRLLNKQFPEQEYQVFEISKSKPALTKKTAKRLKEEDNKTKEKSAIDSVLTWGFNPSKIEKEVEETPFTEEEKEIIKKAKF